MIESLAEMAASFVAWLVFTVVLGYLIFWHGSRLRPIGEVLLPMWLPLAVLLFAGLALFVTDQGRDLGIGLLGAGQFKLFLLALALFYWATGSWHAARLGLNRRFGAKRQSWPEGYELWLRWLPKLIGACAHFFAAWSLALAAKHAIAPDAARLLFVPLWLIAFTPPAVILTAVVILWRHDLRYVAARDALEKVQAAGDDDAAVRAELSAARRWLRLTIWFTVGAGLAIAIGLYSLGDRLPAGLASGTGWILASAALFLLIVSYRKAIGQWVMDRQVLPEGLRTRLASAYHESDAHRATSSVVLAGLLTLVALAVAIAAWLSPVGLGWWAGSMVLGFFAFGAYIAVIDLLQIVFPGPRFAALCVFLLLLAVGTSATRDFHRVRLCGDHLAPCPGASAAASQAGPWVDHRPTVALAANAWYARAKEGWSEDTPVPMLVVATAGGGIRAAYWTTTVLEGLEQQLGRDVLRRHLFAISGVSGGSVGALAYVAAVADDAAPAARPGKILEHDFLAPAVAALAFVDGPSSFLPDLRQGDRGYALERAWELASEGALAKPFLSFFPAREALADGSPWRPALLLNSTHQGTGRRVITSHLQVERSVFLDSFDAHALVEADMPASTAGHNSARFTYVSPAGKLIPPHPKEGGPRDFGFLLDGGYFENFGAVTALQLLREARRALGPDKKVRPIILQISSEPALGARDRARMYDDASLCDTPSGALPFGPDDGGDWLSSFGNELTAPIAGILASRVAHGTLASQELAHAICTLPAETPPRGVDNLLAAAEPAVIGASAPLGPSRDERPQYAHLVMCNEDGSTLPPLGWVLSPLVQGKFVEILHQQCGNDQELGRVIAALSGPET